MALGSRQMALICQLCQQLPSRRAAAIAEVEEEETGPRPGEGRMAGEGADVHPVEAGLLQLLSSPSFWFLLACLAVERAPLLSSWWLRGGDGRGCRRMSAVARGGLARRPLG